MYRLVLFRLLLLLRPPIRVRLQIAGFLVGLRGRLLHGLLLRGRRLYKVGKVSQRLGNAVSVETRGNEVVSFAWTWHCRAIWVGLYI